MKKHQNLLSACASDKSSAHYVLFSADTNQAGHSESVRGQEACKRRQACPEFVRETDHLFPSLSESMQISDLLFDDGEVLLGVTKEDQIHGVKLKTTSILKKNKVPIILGGDHLIKYAALSAFKQNNPNIGILYIDAHPDTDQSVDLYYGSILSHCVKELGYNSEQFLILGLRQTNLAEKKGLDDLNIPFMLASEFQLNDMESIVNKIIQHFGAYNEIYVSIDLDAFDPSEAPAVEAPYPGGIRLLRLKRVLKELFSVKKLAGADISEFVVEQDPDHLTALLSCYLLRELTVHQEKANP